MMRMISKCEGLSGRLEECTRRADQDVARSQCGMSYASVAAKRVEQRVNVSSSANVRVNAIPRADERGYAVVVRASDANVKIDVRRVSRLRRECCGMSVGI